MQKVPCGTSCRSGTPQSMPQLYIKIEKLASQPVDFLVAGALTPTTSHSNPRTDRILLCKRLSDSWLSSTSYYLIKSAQTKEYADFTLRLRKARLDAGLTQVQAGASRKEAQASAIACFKYWTRQQRVDVVELRHFAKLYGKDISFFWNSDVIIYFYRKRIIQFY